MNTDIHKDEILQFSGSRNPPV